MISQYVKEDPEFVNCRSICSGKTPLLVSVLTISVIGGTGLLTVNN